MTPIIMQDQSSIGVSDELRQYIEAIVTEVVLEGKPLEKHKKYLRRFSEAEGIDYESFETQLTEFLDMMEEWKSSKSEACRMATNMLGRKCYLSDDLINRLFDTPAVNAPSPSNGHTGIDPECMNLEVTASQPQRLPLRISNGVVFCTDKSVSGILEIPAAIDGHRVTIIGKEAFKGCHRLTSVVIPSTVTKIRNAAFEGCYGMTAIDIPGSVNVIEKNAFYNCSDLTSITIPESVNEIRERAFMTSGLIAVNIPYSMTDIRASVFEGCSHLTSVVIPNTIQRIECFAFENTGLRTLSIPESVTKIEDAAFRGCSELKAIMVDRRNNNYDSRNNCNAIIETSTNTMVAGCSSTLIPDTLTKIADGIFWNCKHLTVITIPNSVMEIGSWTFFRSGLTEIVIPVSVAKIGFNAFGECDSLRTIFVRDASLLQRAGIPERVQIISDR